MTMDDLAPRIAAYLAHKMPQASKIEVSGVSHIHGGASRETFRPAPVGAKSGKAERARSFCGAIPLRA